MVYEFRRCAKCKKSKPIATSYNIYVSGRQKGKYYSTCRRCRTKIQQQILDQKEMMGEVNRMGSF